MISLIEYLYAPCRVSSIPYWKAKTVTIPAGMKILHHDEFVASEWTDYEDEAYFRLQHDLLDLAVPVLGKGYSLCDASLSVFAAHINSCYDDICITEAELLRYLTHVVYSPFLWLAVREERTGEIVATGIGEIDREIGEGVLEWVQVSEKHRGRGLGSFLVLELLRRMKDEADFATVSGRYDNPTHPEELYRKCGFAGHDIWHILRRQK